MKAGLLGRKLGHSYSPLIHKELGDYSYNLFEKEPEELENFVKYGDYDGINVTVPYKKAVIPYLDELSPIAQKLGAVNVIVRRNGRLIGHNSDFFGFKEMLRRSGAKVAGKKVLVLGSGGASATVCAVLSNHGAEVIVISRSGENNYNNLHLHSDAAFIVNTTPVGMSPNNGQSPIELSILPQLEGVLDVIYNPARTKLLLDAEKRGLIACNGLTMLAAQAVEASAWFTGKEFQPEKVNEIVKLLENETRNIILIGMPGCGKTTVGRALAEKLGREFVDADEELVKRFGPIPAIFETEGEAGFRKKETAVLAELGKRSGIILATGGGCVTKEENDPLLHQNGTIIWLQRPIEQLPTDGRPLSKGNLNEMYEIRKPLYERFSDYSVESNNACADIIRILEEMT